jgi:CheY-like chemotaxis protein
METSKPPLVILFVDDNVDACDIYAQLLPPEGFRCVITGGANAVEAALSHLPALIVMDGLILPNAEPVQRFKRDPRTRDIPILIVSAHAMKEERNQAMIAGADDFLAKPALPDDLLAHIRALVNRSGNATGV